MNVEKHDIEIERTLRAARFIVPGEVEERVLADATREMRRVQAQRSRIAVVWRRAAIVMLAVGGVVALLAYLRQPGLTLAQVRDAVAKQAWAHVKFDNGGERWVNLADRARFEKDFDGRVMVTRADGVSLWCWSNGGQIFEGPLGKGGGAKPQAAGSSAWEWIVEPYERAVEAEQNGGPKGAVERAIDSLDGKRAIRFSSYYTDALGRRRLVEEVWADEPTRLPVQVRRWVTKISRGGEATQQSTTGRFDFPANGPATIYDLGVPREWEIVRIDATPPEEVMEVLRRSTAGAAKFPKRYRAVMWPTDLEGNWLISLVYQDGEKRRTERHSVPRESASSPATVVEKGGAPERPSADLAVAWMKTQTSGNVEVYDGEKRFSRSGPFQKWVRSGLKRPRASVLAMKWSSFADAPEAAQWPMSSEMRGMNLKLVKDVAAPEGIVVLEWRLQDERREYWLDVSKDYLCVKWVRFKQQGGAWKREREMRMTSIEPFHGSWLARGREVDYFGVFPLADEPTQTEKHSVEVNVDSEIPAEAFDGKKLLEGADVSGG